MNLLERHHYGDVREYVESLQDSESEQANTDEEQEAEDDDQPDDAESDDQ